jgi:alanyl-tRNA synthetase
LTRKLYQDDSYITDFKALVVSVEDYEGRQAIELDATHFYPESGGQPGDTGLIGGIPIAATVAVAAGAEKADRILHLTSASPKFDEGATVEAKIDWPKRFINMQQHTGQHILSQAFLAEADAATISSRLGVEHSTVDISRLDLTGEEMEKVEKLANSVIYENRPVKIYEIAPEEVSGLRRKEPAGLDRIRVVEIARFDKTPCGGTHTRATGEVGLIKILRSEKVRETTRVEFICGELARADYFWKSKFVEELAQDLTTRDTNVPDLVRDLYEEHRQLRYAHEQLRKELTGYRARTLLEAAAREIGNAIVIVAHIEDAQVEEIREMASLLTSAGGPPGESLAGEGIVALLASGREEVHFIFARSEDVSADMRPLIKAATAIVDGKGGGRPEVCQGGGKDGEKAGQALEEAVRLLAELLGG